MGMSLLHAVTFVLTILLFVVRHRHALSGVYSAKFGVPQQGSRYTSCDKAGVSASSSAVCVPVAVLGLASPKYKRDPDIHVDSEQIGYEPRCFRRYL